MRCGSASNFRYVNVGCGSCGYPGPGLDGVVRLNRALVGDREWDGDHYRR